LIAAKQRTERLAFVDKKHDRLELATGTTISRAEIDSFRLYHCKTKTSNFRVLLLTAIACDTDGERGSQAGSLCHLQAKQFHLQAEQFRLQVMQ